MNIVESIKEDINSELTNALASANNETVEKTKNTIETSVTSILLAFMKRASTETGLHLLHNLTTTANFGLNQPFDTIFPSEKINKYADEGNALISKIIPDKKSPLITFVSSYSGVRNAAANRTNGIVTLLILNKLKEVSAKKSLELGGLAELFADQKDYLIESAPKNLIEKLSQHIGLGNLISLGSSIITTSASLNTKTEREKLKSLENNQRNSVTETQNTGQGFNAKNWIIPGIFGLLILGLAGYYAYTEYYSTNTPEENLPKDTLVNINNLKIDSLKPKLTDSLTNIGNDTLVIEMEETTLPNGQKISIEKNNLAGQVLSFLNDTTKTNIKNISSQYASFGNTGQDVIADQTENYTNIGKILKAYPQARIKVTVNDFAANDSTFNDKRATKRAFAIKRIFMNNGIEPIRIDAVGKVKNTSPTAAQKAKEVELVVMKK